MAGTGANAGLGIPPTGAEEPTAPLKPSTFSKRGQRASRLNVTAEERGASLSVCSDRHLKARRMLTLSRVGEGLLHHVANLPSVSIVRHSISGHTPRAP